MTAPGASAAQEHLRSLRHALNALDSELRRIAAWGQDLAAHLDAGSRLLVVGNGGSAALAQHVTAELVGRYRDERRPLSALALHSESSTFTALLNDYGPEEVFARQVRAHGRRGDVLLSLSTSGRSENALSAVHAAHEVGMKTWALTGAAPNPLASLAGDAVCVASESTPTIQEVHQVVVHLLCEAVDDGIARRVRASPFISSGRVRR